MKTAFLFAAALVAGRAPVALAQSTTWDALLTNSQWYVPAENMLAYATSGASLASPQAIADQTIWTLGECTDGLFGGTSVATFKLGPVTATSTTTMSGIITEAGQVRISFTQDGSPATIGIGQAREISGVTLIEMQMMTGGGDPALYITHWAYMAPYDGNPSSLPPLEIESSLRSEEWNWMPGTTWSLASDELFGAGGTGQFYVDDYRNGYFWGVGSGPADSPAEAFTLLGSATPEGNILFNLLNENGEFTSLTGLISGDADTGVMALRSYSADDVFGALTYAQVIPEPSSFVLVLGALLVTSLCARRSHLRRHCARLIVRP